ncbi:GNAT family N-acetyltransferase [Desmospora profundinema]|uniref:RimJ/RimL family protein N-acetyltransferase n=1 Tax=Desmospora profundinema TaxID=1571184 RepID=A0ABU1IMD2_9BACL|nr:GNAT family N-acetyltransferase [Desmospora profundinema]MDR6225119.1 RimJ/RimL family protein N-acetyltransferase [Desmospora profundinema]
MSPLPLTTVRLHLQPFDLADAPAVQEWAKDARVAATTLNIPHPYPDGAAEDWIGSLHEQHHRNRGTTVAIRLRHDDTLIGAMGLGIHPQHNRAELAYWIGVPYWGQGYATEAARAVIRYGFQDLGLHRIWAAAMVHNPASSRVLEKAGLKREGLLRQHVKKGDTYIDLVYYGLLQEEWASLCN